jgi:hypothetical protein
MEDLFPPEQSMSENGPRYDNAARAAAEILNLHWGTDQPKATIFSKLLFTILQAMYQAEAELNGMIYEPSEN